MAETQYKEHKAGKPKAPPISLLEILGARSLIVSLNAFGPSHFDQNAAKMREQYSHPDTGEIIQLREPTTAESILAASYDFSNKAKPKILDPRWLQLGRIVRTSEGVYANVPKQAFNDSEADEGKLKKLLENARKIKVAEGHVYLGDNDFGFAEYETFTREVQDAGDFAESGLARVLEHTEKAHNLRAIADIKNYPLGVNVLGFDSVSSPVLKVVSLPSGGLFDSRRLHVYGDDWGDGYDGFAFGVLNSAEGTAQKI